MKKSKQKNLHNCSHEINSRINHSAADEFSVSTVNDQSAEMLTEVFDIQTDDIPVSKAQSDLNQGIIDI
jgi:hypothetical protein